MKQATPHLYWVGGPSTAGKTSILPLLKNALTDLPYIVHDFDENNFGAASSEEMRKKAIQWWLRQANRNAKRGISTVIGGAIFPSELAEERDALGGVDLYFCLLDMNHAVIDKRLRARLRHPEDGKKWKKAVGLGPKESIALNIVTAKRYRKECKHYGGKRFNTSKTTPERTTEKVVRWILSH